MQQAIVILGAGDFARETYWHLRDSLPEYRALFADDVSDRTAIEIGDECLPVVKDWCFDSLRLDDSPVTVRQFIIGVGSPKAKQAMAVKACAAGLEPIPTVVHPRALVQDKRCELGRGGIITPGCVLTTAITLGDGVLLNLNSTIGHDAVLGDWVTVNPGCNISGRVHLGEGTLVGTGASIREGISVAPATTIGAGAVVVKNQDTPGVVLAGVPARPLK